MLKNVINRIKGKKAFIDKFKNEDTIFVYQMGKVGSTALESAISNSLHIHAFYSKNTTCLPRLKGQAKFGFRYFYFRLEQELISYLVRRVFRKRKKTKIITLVRAPLQRNISMFFHDLDAYLFAAHTNCLGTRTTALPTRSQSANLLTNVFNQEFDHQYPLTWFDREFKEMTGIDIYAYKFDKHAGVSRIETEHFDILCLQMDKLPEQEQLLTTFVGKPVSLKRENKANNKWYGSLYRDFKRDYQLSDEQIQIMHNSKYYQHFFAK
ncbi:putative capsular polysaccharide synthesis family protein [Thalassotalea sediminis]|uniref:putative capsular polysaccharide synthesis family protein n=1 Tax=Thalassotalea sediminis TaxID=1759089 RepID=UPI0025748CDE|nr:putative capsular polysaccharide synthesis family protein [Thalassotalea sediminis]